LEFNNELNFSVRWHPRQIIRKDIRILTNYRNVLNFEVCDSVSARIEIFLPGQIEGNGPTMG
jgi:hypothetical protein